jgi:hypothetical protein
MGCEREGAEPAEMEMICNFLIQIKGVYTRMAV